MLQNVKIEINFYDFDHSQNPATAGNGNSLKGIDIFQKYVGDKANLKSSHYVIIRDLISKCLDKNMGSLFGLYNQEEEVLAMSFIVHYANRDILLFNVSSKSLQSNAMTVLVDDYVQKECLQNKVLDFEGSNISGVKRFYKGFGAVERNYIHIQK